LEFVVGIAYEDDINKAISIIEDTARNVEEVLQEKPPFTVVEELDTNTVNIRVFFWTATDDYKKGVLITKSNVMTQVKEKLIENGFTLPANIQELKLY
jgi:small-conductance mechanosensitive channel